MLGVSLLNTGSNSGTTMRSGGNQTACFVAVITVHECLKELEMADCIDCCIFGEQPMLLMSTADTTVTLNPNFLDTTTEFEASLSGLSPVGFRD